MRDIKTQKKKDIIPILGGVYMNEENKVYGKVNFDGTTENIGTKYENDCSKFKVCDNANLPVKPSFFTKLKNILFYEIKVELTPHQQKIEDEINEFLHQEVTWQSFKNFLFKEVEITHRGKRIL